MWASFPELLLQGFEDNKTPQRAFFRLDVAEEKESGPSKERGTSV